MYVYVADELGFVKIWYINHVIEFYNVKKVPKWCDTKPSFNPFRQETIDASHYINDLRETLLKKKNTEPPAIVDP